jgi:hypothetical protein
LNAFVHAVASACARNISLANWTASLVTPMGLGCPIAI